jgi:hypothetical protein
MRIAAFLGVKDEVELVETAIRHLRRIGVDLIIACDSNSTDGTLEILELHRSDADFWIRTFDDRHVGPEDWPHLAMTVVAEARAAGIDWILFQDADEFWLPKTGHLKDCSALNSFDVLSVKRYNAPLKAESPQVPALEPDNYEQLLLFVEQASDLRTQLVDDSAMAWISGVPTAKCLARVECIAGVSAAGHSIDGDRLRQTVPADLLIAHFPFTTRPRFAKKVKNIKALFSGIDVEIPPELAWHWRRWLELDRQGGIDEEYRRSVPTGAALTELAQKGALRSAAQLLRT